MRFKKIALALFACLALGAFAANAAQAEGTGWTVNGNLIPSGTHEEVTCAKHGTETLKFTSTLLGAPIELTASGIDCLRAKGSALGATIDNTTSPNHSEGVLTFTDVTVVKPKGCMVPGNELTTEPLTDTVIMDPTAGSTTVFDKFFPEVAGGAFVEIEFTGEECALAGNKAPVKGTACGEAVHTNAGGTGYEANKTGELRTVQTLLFGSAQQTTGGCKLTFGAATAQLTGVVDNELQSKQPFGSD